MNDSIACETQQIASPNEQKHILVTTTPALNNALIPIAARYNYVSREDVMEWFARLTAAFQDLECSGLLPEHSGIINPMLGLPAMRYVKAEAMDGSVMWICVSL